MKFNGNFGAMELADRLLEKNCSGVGVSEELYNEALNGLYYLKSCAENEMNFDYFRGLWYFLETIAAREGEFEIPEF